MDIWEIYNLNTEKIYKKINYFSVDFTIDNLGNLKCSCRTGKVSSIVKSHSGTAGFMNWFSDFGLAPVIIMASYSKSYSRKWKKKSQKFMLEKKEAKKILHLNFSIRFK